MRHILFILIICMLLPQSILGNNNTEFLVAKYSMPDSRFKETVIVMLYHNIEEGAAGLVINKPVEKMFLKELFMISNLPLPEKIIEKEITIYWGGPVNPSNIYFIHSPDYKSNDFISSNKDFTITKDPKILFDIANSKGPQKYIILLGISVWEPGQLDSEIIRDDWHIKFNTYTSLFDNENNMWSRLINSRDI